MQRHLPLATALTQLQAEDAVWLSQIKTREKAPDIKNVRRDKQSPLTNGPEPEPVHPTGWRPKIKTEKMNKKNAREKEMHVPKKIAGKSTHRRRK